MSEDCIVDNNTFLHFDCFICDKCGKKLKGLLYGHMKSGNVNYDRLCTDCCKNSFQVTIKPPSSNSNTTNTNSNANTNTNTNASANINLNLDARATTQAVMS